jgi:hypothetical protein
MDAAIYNCRRRGERPRNCDKAADWAVVVTVVVIDGCEVPGVGV